MEPNSNTNITSSPPDTMQHHAWNSPWFGTRAPMGLTQNPSRNFNLNNDENEDDDDRSSTVEQQGHEVIEKEGMFEKALTPSDVGKLNRLVIPKQHAEKYFPLGGDSGDKGLLLGFEDDSGKCWRFRYSYWNSSQSYVLTKGWSRYVKDKQLDAGDVVFFQRHPTDRKRFFIGWRRRNAEGSVTAAQPSTAAVGRDQWTRVFYPAHAYPTHPSVALPLPYQPDYAHAGMGSRTATVPAGNLKRLRLFGVNLECQSEESEPDGNASSSVSTHAAPNYQHYYSSQPYASIHHNLMDTM